MFRTSVGFVVMFLGTVAVSTLSAETITVMDATHANGWFNSPDVPAAGWIEPQPPTGWSVTGTIWSQGMQDGGVDAGGQFVYWASPGTGTNYLYQEGLHTVASAGEQVTMTYYIGSNAGLTGEGYIQSWLNLKGTDTNVTNGPVACKGTTLGGTGSLQTLTYTTTTGDIGAALAVTFNFRQEDATSVQLFLDNVTVTVAPVPEPSTVGLLVSGLFGLLAYAWRKRK